MIGVGPEAAQYEPDSQASDPIEAAELLEGMIEPDSVILVKGSRSAGLEAVAEQLVEREGA